MNAISFIGFGQLGRTVAENLRLPSMSLRRVWDIVISDSARPASLNARQLGITPSPSAAESACAADLIISAVTPAQGLAAEAVASAIMPGSWIPDINSAAPEQKRAGAGVIEKSGGRYVEAAVRSPIQPLRPAAPIVLGGPRAAAFIDCVKPLGFTGTQAHSTSTGAAAAAKLCRSIVITGIEAMMSESLLTARARGVESEVLTSLANVLPSGAWEVLASCMIEQALIHGERQGKR